MLKYLTNTLGKYTYDEIRKYLILNLLAEPK